MHGVIDTSLYENVSIAPVCVTVFPLAGNTIQRSRLLTAETMETKLQSADLYRAFEGSGMYLYSTARTACDLSDNSTLQDAVPMVFESLRQIYFAMTRDVQIMH